MSLCPHCGHSISLTAGEAPRSPKKGDLAICYRCLELSFFTGPNALEKTTIDKIPSHMRETVEKYRAALLASKEKH